jgi:hypothetical protein
MSDFQPDQIGYYGQPLTSLTKEELLKAAMELAEIIFNCPVKGKCKGIIAPIETDFFS